MTVRLQSISGSRVTLELTVDLEDSMLASEEAIQTGLNEAGRSLSELALKAFDTDGRKIEKDGRVWHNKGLQPKTYQTPYGDVSVERHVYQRSGGGKTFCPLEHDARIILTSTPHFCRQVSWKMAYGGARDVRQDLLNHGRTFQVYAIQRLAEAACKTLIKKRPCRSGMCWKDKGVRVILSLRELDLTPVRWQQFWEKLNGEGLPVNA